ncbi:MAG: signal recognition particle-docking protein FtsY, partial [Mesorhizobium sp.]
MAGFFKKIFSFGKKEVVEERVDETAPLPPIKWDALDALKPAAEEPKPEPAPDIPPAPEPVIPPAPE